MNETRKLVFYIAASLDGYIARENGEIDWLDYAEGEGDNGYAEFYSTVDTIIMGKATYDHIWTLVEEFPYPGKPCYVFSRSETRNDPHVKFVNGDVRRFTEELKQQEGTNIWLVGGSELAADFLKTGLVDELILTIIPVVLGSGIPLFRSGIPETMFTLKEVRRFGQLAQLHYIAK